MHAMHMRAVEHTIRRGLCTQPDAWVNYTENRCREAQLAASTAADIANTTNSELHLLTVAPGNPDPVYQIHEGSLRYETYQQALEAVKGEAQKVLDEQVQKVKEAG